MKKTPNPTVKIYYKRDVKGQTGKELSGKALVFIYVDCEDGRWKQSAKVFADYYCTRSRKNGKDLKEYKYSFTENDQQILDSRLKQVRKIATNFFVKSTIITRDKIERAIENEIESSTRLAIEQEEQQKENDVINYIRKVYLVVRKKL